MVFARRSGMSSHNTETGRFTPHRQRDCLDYLRHANRTSNVAPSALASDPSEQRLPWVGRAPPRCRHKFLRCDLAKNQSSPPPTAAFDPCGARFAAQWICSLRRHHRASEPGVNSNAQANIRAVANPIASNPASAFIAHQNASSTGYRIAARSGTNHALTTVPCLMLMTPPSKARCMLSSPRACAATV